MKKQIFDALHQMCDGKKNQDEIAKSIGISRPYLNRLLNKKRPIDGITLRALLKLFPHATINLHGDSVIADNSGINNGVMGVNNGTVNTAGHESVEAFRHKIQDEIIRADVDSESKVKILNIILNTEAK